MPCDCPARSWPTKLPNSACDQQEVACQGRSGLPSVRASSTAIASASRAGRQMRGGGEAAGGQPRRRAARPARRRGHGRARRHVALSRMYASTSSGARLASSMPASRRPLQAATRSGRRRPAPGTRPRQTSTGPPGRLPDGLPQLARRPPGRVAERVERRARAGRAPCAVSAGPPPAPAAPVRRTGPRPRRCSARPAPPTAPRAAGPGRIAATTAGASTASRRNACAAGAGALQQAGGVPTTSNVASPTSWRPATRSVAMIGQPIAAARKRLSGAAMAANSGWPLARSKSAGSVVRCSAAGVDRPPASARRPARTRRKPTVDVGLAGRRWRGVDHLEDDRQPLVVGEASSRAGVTSSAPMA